MLPGPKSQLYFLPVPLWASLLVPHFPHLQNGVQIKSICPRADGKMHGLNMCEAVRVRRAQMLTIVLPACLPCTAQAAGSFLGKLHTGESHGWGPMTG